MWIAIGIAVGSELIPPVGINPNQWDENYEERMKWIDCFYRSILALLDRIILSSSSVSFLLRYNANNADFMNEVGFYAVEELSIYLSIPYS